MACCTSQVELAMHFVLFALLSGHLLHKLLIAQCDQGDRGCNICINNGPRVLKSQGCCHALPLACIAIDAVAVTIYGSLACCVRRPCFRV